MEGGWEDNRGRDGAVSLRIENVATGDWAKNSSMTARRYSGAVLLNFISFCFNWAVWGVNFSRTIIQRSVTAHHTRLQVGKILETDNDHNYVS